jgi:hypothetical protein
MLVPRNHLLVITAHQRTIIEAIEFEDQEGEDEKVEEAPADETEVKNEIEETMASEWDLAGAATEKITGEEELREVCQRPVLPRQHAGVDRSLTRSFSYLQEVLRDPRNMMKVGKNRGSVEEQKKVKKELKDKAPDFGNMPTFDAGRRRHSLASWYPRMASDHPSAGVTSLSPLPPTTGHATPPLVHRANSSVGDAPRKRPHKRADRLEVMPSDLYSSPQPTHAASASSSPMNLKLVETGGESDTKDAKDLQKATKSKKHDTTKPDLTEEGQEKDAMGLQKRKAVSPVEDLDVRAGSVGEPLEKLKNKGKAKLDELGKSLDVSRSDAMAVTKQALSAAGDMHIRLDMSKGFLLLAIVNVLCAIMWAARC